MSKNKISDILEKEIEEEVFEKMPVWFNVLYKKYKQRKNSA